MEGLRILDWILLGLTGVLGAGLGVLSRRVSRIWAALPSPDREGSPHVAAELRAVRDEQARLAQQLARCVQRVGMVRYDAFRDAGGRLSFSLALLDAKGDGVVLSVLHGRENSYAYAKALRDGKASQPLSEEEQQAVAQAMEA